MAGTMIAVAWIAVMMATAVAVYWWAECRDAQRRARHLADDISAYESRIAADAESLQAMSARIGELVHDVESADASIEQLTERLRLASIDIDGLQKNAARHMAGARALDIKLFDIRHIVGTHFGANASLGMRKIAAVLNADA